LKPASGFSHRARRVSPILIAVVLASVWFLPVIFILLEMFKENNEILMNPWALPTRIRFDLILKAWKSSSFSTYYVNSVYITVVGIGATLLLVCLASYAFARMRFPLKGLIFTYVISGMMISIYTIIIPLYLLMKRLALLDTREALLLANIGTAIPFSTYFLTSFFRSLPVELEEAARIDGCSRMRILVRIILPLSKPGLSALMIFLFAGFWNEFYMALVFLSRNSIRTVPLGLMYFAGQYSQDINGGISAVIIACVPIIVVYFVFQRYFIRGLTAGALKG
jgi:raffinose/stachyose/melibiose transport system permease protein